MGQHDDDDFDYLSIKNRPFPAASERQLRFYGWLLYGLGFVTVVVTGFVVRTQIKLSEFDDLRAKREAQLSRLEAYESGNTLITTQLADRDRNLENWRNAIEKEHIEMWFMKQHGISNKEDFQQRLHYQAPSDPNAGEEHP